MSEAMRERCAALLASTGESVYVVDGVPYTYAEMARALRRVARRARLNDRRTSRKRIRRLGWERRA